MDSADGNRIMRELTEDPDISKITNWLMSLRLLASHVVCTTCNSEMKCIQWRNSPDKRKWKCSTCLRHQSLRCGSIFHIKKLRKTSLRDIVRYLWHWSSGVDHRAIFRLGYINVKTARILRDEIHCICVQVMLTHPPKIESNHALTVAIDESVFIKRKYNRGRVPANMTWVLGMVNLDDSSKGIFLCVADRRADTLVPAIRTYVQQGATIVTDCWRGYDQLAHNGFMHLTVNHSRNFVDPRTGAHTNHVENAWRLVKQYIKESRIRLCGPVKTQELLYVYMWRQWRGKTWPGGMLACLLTEIFKKYPL